MCPLTLAGFYNLYEASGHACQTMETYLEYGLPLVPNCYFLEPDGGKYAHLHAFPSDKPVR